MKRILFLLILFFGFFSFSQEKGKHQFTFIDQCTNLIVKPEYSIDTIINSNDIFINVFLERKKGWVSSYSDQLNSKFDTIFIPRLLFSSGSELHSERWSYFLCDKIAGKNEVDYYKKGNKRIEGNFINGKPIEIKEYRKSGILSSQTIYKEGLLQYERINYFDFKGVIYEYEIYKHRRRKTIIKRYNRNNKLISKEIENH